MRCRECAAEVAVTARVCSRCGALIVGQPPLVADAVVADTVVAAVSDAAGKAVPAGVAGQALPELYVPGSGDRLSAELRLVLAGYVGVAAGIFTAGLAAAAAAIVFLVDLDDLDDDLIGLLLGLASMVSFLLLWILPALGAFGLLKARVRFRGCSGGPPIHARLRWWP
jgi:hypothetical protein